MRIWFSQFALWRDRTLRFRADWWRDVARWLTQGGSFKRIREQRAQQDKPPVKLTVHQGNQRRP